jgi:hypothetical protein
VTSCIALRRRPSVVHSEAIRGGDDCWRRCTIHVARRPHTKSGAIDISPQNPSRCYRQLQESPPMLRRILYTAVIICFVTIHVMALRKIDAMASARVAARPTISQFTD